MKGERILKTYKVTKGGATHVEVVLRYNKGGMNYFQGVNEVRGLYLSVSPFTRTEYEGGLFSRSFTAFSGTKMLVKELKRFSDKTLNEFVPDQADIDKLMSHVLSKNGIELETI